MASYEYIQFLNDHILPYLPTPNIKYGDRINFRCPFCGDSKKSATKKRGWFYLNGGGYYCFNCGTSMSGIKLLEQLAGTDFGDIKSEYIKIFLKSGMSGQLSSTHAIPVDEPNVFNVKSIVNPNWKHALSDDAKSYLENRRIFDAPYFKDQLYSTYGANQQDEYILIPWVVNGIDAYYQLNDFKHIKGLKYIFPKNKKKLIYGIDNVDPSFPYIFIFEGVYDSLFVKNGVASGTKSITEYQIKLLKSRWPRHTLCCAYDNDKAGISSIAKLIENGTNMKFFKWFDATTKQKDINDYVLASGNANAFTNAAQLEEMVCDSLQMKMFLIQNGLWSTEYYKQRYFKKHSADKPNIDNGLSFIQKRSAFMI